VISTDFRWDGKIAIAGNTGRAFDILRQDILAAALDFSGDVEQRLEFVRDGRSSEIP
jgi:hypothetical protein